MPEDLHAPPTSSCCSNLRCGLEDGGKERLERDVAPEEAGADLVQSKDLVADEVYARVDVATRTRVGWILRHLDTRLIVLVYPRRCTLLIPEVLEQVSEIQHLLTALTGCDKLGFS
eukprot:726035-Rhodomonas_salina.1